jgi:Zn-finger nucleic acid-binding protein
MFEFIFALAETTFFRFLFASTTCPKCGAALQRLQKPRQKIYCCAGYNGHWMNSDGEWQPVKSSQKSQTIQT